jgi:hypothetical protein
MTLHYFFSRLYDFTGTWHQLCASGPPPRVGAAMVAVTANDQNFVVVVGGFPSFDQFPMGSLNTVFSMQLEVTCPYVVFDCMFSSLAI